MAINFKYIDYNNDTKNNLFESIQKYVKPGNLIIVENEMSKKFFFSAINKKNIRIFDSIISLDSFKEKLYFSQKNILKDIKRFLIFYACLSKEIKDELNINSYYDCIEIAKDFFEFFKCIKDKENLENLNLTKWQEKKVEIFYSIKENLDKCLEENNYIPSDWIEKEENLDFFYIKDFKKLVFFDVVDFPYNFIKILECIQKEINIEIEIILQIDKEDFDIKNLKIKNITLPKREIDLTLNSYKNDFEFYNLIKTKIKNSKNIENLQAYSINLNLEDDYSIFQNSNKNIFNDTKLYKLLEAYINILENIDDKNGLVELFKLKENIFSSTFMEFYGLDIEDYKNFEEILEADFRYISYQILESGKFDYYFRENENLLKKLKELLKNIEEIKDIKNISELSLYLKNKFFSTEEDVNYFSENKYSSIYDIFYEILGILSSNENMNYFQNLGKFFEKNLGKNIFILFFNYLNKITIYSLDEDKKNINEKLALKDLYSAKFISQANKKNLILYTDMQNLPKTKKNNSIFTEQQKAKLALKTYEDEIQIEKYRTFQNMLNFQNMEIYSKVDLDENIDFSAFIYEFINMYNISNNKEEVIDFKENIFEEKNNAHIIKNKSFRAYKKEKSDFKDGILKIGAYDYSYLIKEETFFFLEKLCQLSADNEIEETNGISAKLLGNILHKCMEDIFRAKWKDILIDNKNILIKESEIKEILIKNFKKEELKIENFMKNYVDEILINRLAKNIEKFFYFIYQEVKDSKIKRIEAEKTDRRERPFYEYNDIQVFFTGRADLLLETDKANYIIDFKTGIENKEQLEFYALMFYGNLENTLPIYSFAYNLWNETEAGDKDLSKVLVKDMNELKNRTQEKLRIFLENPYYKLPSQSKLRENKNNFKKSYNFKYLCPIDKIETK